MRYKLSFIAGAALGYVLGARAGRQRYEQLSDLGARVAATPPVQKAKDTATEQVSHLAEQAKHAVGDKVAAVVADGKEALVEGRHRVEDALGDRLPERFRSDDESVEEARAAASTTTKPSTVTPITPTSQTAPGAPKGAGAGI